MPNLAEVLTSLPADLPGHVLTDIQHELAALNQKVVVLDDDPTGTQSVHGHSRAD